MVKTVDNAEKTVMEHEEEERNVGRWTAKLPLRWKRSLGSLRTHLIVWNIVALSLLVGGLGVVCRYAIEKFLMQSIDHDLENSIGMYIHPPRKHGRPPGPPDGKSGDRPEP